MRRLSVVRVNRLADGWAFVKGGIFEGCEGVPSQRGCT